MRTKSDATKLREERQFLRIADEHITLLEEELRQRRTWGGMMANLCFNLAQNDAYDAAHRSSMKDCRENWDKIKMVK